MDYEGDRDDMHQPSNNLPPWNIRALSLNGLKTANELTIEDR